MKTRARLRHSIAKFGLLLLFIILPLQNVTALSISGTPVKRSTAFAGTIQLTPPLNQALSYPTDPTADIPWSGGMSTVADIQAAFNNARTIENNQLGTSIPMMTLPTQIEWNGMNDGQKALWLINRERIDRGVAPLQGLEANVGSVAQYYADYLLDHNAWGHTADGRSPWQRLEDNPAIGACHDFLSVAENIYAFVTSGSSIPLPIERAIYGWMYEDGPCCSWGHRHAILWYPYNDNSGTVGSEGFLGIGRANGGPYQGPFSQPWNFAELIVMNVFDPCAGWNDSAPIVNSITRADPNPTSASSVNYIVTFSESVIGVGTNDFTLTVTGGISGASVNAISGSGSTRTVTVNTGLGNGLIRLDVVDDDSIKDASNQPLGGVGAGNGNYSGGETYSVQKRLTIRSAGTNDGWVLESAESSNQGGQMNSGALTFNLGDNAADQQYRAILHFNTSALPDNAVITKVILKIRKQGLVGINPFTTHMKIAVDIRKGTFSNAAVLQLTDFQAAASRNAVGLITNNPQTGNWYFTNLNPAAFPLTNLTGITQFRLRFQLDDNNDLGADFLKFYSGNATTAADRPVLIIEYSVP